jgi:NAD+ synthase
MFDAKKVKGELIAWIRDYFDKNGRDSSAVIGISGGKDSSIVAALCVEALGKERVHGVMMRNGKQHDIDISFELCDHLGIDYTSFVITDVVESMYSHLDIFGELNEVVTQNTPARIRMTMLYAISAMVGGRVANTCNLSEKYIGYSTKYGDGAGDFSPLSNLTCTEVIEIGRLLLPDKFVDKVPEDGLCGKTDEDNFGFTYEVLDKYIRTGKIDCEETNEKIDRMHTYSMHKRENMPSFEMEDKSDEQNAN